MNLFGVGPTEIFVVLIIILVLFGPERLPEIAKKIGSASREIRSNLDSLNEQMNSTLEASMDAERAQMIKPTETPIVDSTAQTIEPPKAESTDQTAEPPTSPAPPT